MLDPSVVILVLSVLLLPFWALTALMRTYPNLRAWVMNFAKRVLRCDDAPPVGAFSVILFILALILLWPSTVLARIMRMTPVPPDQFCFGVGLKPCRFCPRYRNRSQEADDGEGQSSTPR